jgi:glycosyltransferase involved in cell wall biosynthesis
MVAGRMKVLFLGHNATRTGAPLLLLELMRWLSARHTITPSLLLWQGGPLEEDYGKVAVTKVICASRWTRTAARFGIAAPILNQLRQDACLTDCGVIYANTAACAKLIPHLAGKGKPIIHHIHELEGAATRLGMIEALRRNVDATDLYIAASEAVGHFLRTTIAVPPERIRVIHEFAINLPCQSTALANRVKIRSQLHLHEKDVLVMMSGTPEARKGTDIFIQLAAMVQRTRGGDRLRCLWLGGSPKQLSADQKLAAQTGVGSICSFHASVTRPQDWLTAADIFSLTSREEPFSVVMLEAAMNAIPILCFAKAGGGPELVENDAGFVIDDSDLPAMAAACIDLAKDKFLRLRMGEIAQRKVIENYLIDRQAARIEQEILNLATGHHAPRQMQGRNSIKERFGGGYH